MKNKTPLQSIRAKCLDCAGTSKEVTNCEFADCPLHELRIGRHLPRGISRLKAIRRYCVTWCMNDQPKEVRLCPTTYCSLYPLRFAKNPYRRRASRTKIAPEQALEFKKGVADTGFFQQSDAGQ
jgi:hypothetical protein